MNCNRHITNYNTIIVNRSILSPTAWTTDSDGAFLMSLIRYRHVLQILKQYHRCIETCANVSWTRKLALVQMLYTVNI